MLHQPLLAVLFTWLTYFGLTLATIMIDGRMQRAKARADGGVDFMDRSPWSYIILGIFCGPLPLIFYFGTTRKNAAGWLIGIGIAIAVFLATMVASVVFQLIFGRLS